MLLSSCTTPNLKIVALFRRVNCFCLLGHTLESTRSCSRGRRSSTCPSEINTRQPMLISPEVHSTSFSTGSNTNIYPRSLFFFLTQQVYSLICYYLPFYLPCSSFIFSDFVGTNKPFSLHFLRLLSLYSCKQKVAHSKYVDENK